MNLGDIRVGATVGFKFTTRRFSTGAPYTFAANAGSPTEGPTVSVYKSGSTTESTAGVTLTVDYDSRTGLNAVVIDTSADGSFYAAANDFDVVITAGTVDSVSVVGETVASFSIENRSALMPTTSGRKLDVSAGGEAGLDWANVGSPTTSLALTGTTIATTQKVDIETIKTNPVVNGGTVTFPTTETLASTTNITAGTITTVTNLTNAPTAGDLTATMKASVNTEVDSAIETYHLDHLLAAAYDVLNKPGDASALFNVLIENEGSPPTPRFTQIALEQAPTGGSAPTAVQIRQEMDSNSTQLAAIVADTNELQTDWTNGGRLDLLIDAVKAKTDSLTFTVASVVDANIQRVNDVAITGDGSGTPFNV